MLKLKLKKVKDVTTKTLFNTDNSESLLDLLPGFNQKTNHPIQARKVMAIVNEYATEENTEKYDLYGIWDKFNPLRKGKCYIGQRPSVTVDREKYISIKIGK
ncbi:MAG: hypothetical protein JAY62_14290 [Candidatus Thiodiazotropha endolucinida]|nr:hypothetical protein [Candidatus Thiodiazotropha taylori]MCW4276295.1 hypothetical protein [Candidatus Thiodiazotropha taylori]